MSDLPQKACTSMIKYTPASERTLALFRTPFEQSLDPDNRWVRMAALVPWDDMAKIFFAHMSVDQGRGSVDLRVVLGALLVKHIEGISDEDTIQCIQENLYAQYFVGLPSFQTTPVFSPTLFVEIRKRLGKAGVVNLNDVLLLHARKLRAIKHRARPVRKKEDNAADPPSDPPPASLDKSPTQAPEQERLKNKGTIKLDATAAPQHIGYPTDTRLLHEARQISEQLIDELYEQTGRWSIKPRTYRRVAHKKYLAFAKKRNPKKKIIRKIQGQQLRYLKRNISHLYRMLDELEQQLIDIPWKYRHWKQFWVIQELYDQQYVMWRDKRRRVDDRIVNVAQPYVRPIKRGKAGSDTEFGAKINGSETEGFLRMDQVDFDNFHEGLGLKLQIEGYKTLYGYYPELVLVDRIYLTRTNRNYLKDKGIRHVGPPLGHPPPYSKAEKDKRRKEQRNRNHIEGKFGQAKSKYGLDDIQTRREDTSYACIGLILLALNVIKLGKGAFFSFLATFITRTKTLGAQLVLLILSSRRWTPSFKIS